MKWFMPPMRMKRSHRQAAIQEPSTVTMAISSRETKYSPGNTLAELVEVRVVVEERGLARLARLALELLQR